MARLTEVCAIKETTTGKTPTGMVAEYVGSMPNDLLKRVEELADDHRTEGRPEGRGQGEADQGGLPEVARRSFRSLLKMSRLTEVYAPTLTEQSLAPEQEALVKKYRRVIIGAIQNHKGDPKQLEQGIDKVLRAFAVDSEKAEGEDPKDLG